MNIQRRKLRDIHGILLLDKPEGMTSNMALQRVKRLFAAAKAGHTGSLDPLASGMLPVCLGQATKLSQFLLEADKQYEVTAKLGVKTTTGDTEGEVIAIAPAQHIQAQDIEAALEKFRGMIEQVPSMYSALKHKGQPLYKLARQGIEVERPRRQVTIFELNLLAYQGDLASFYVRCSKGTYVRTLVEDLGEVLGCGAHVCKLRRLAVGHYAEEQMVSFETLDRLREQENQGALERYLLPVASALADWPEVRLSEAAAFYLKQGQPVIVPRAPSAGMVRLSLQGNQLLGVGEILEDGRVAPRRLLQMEYKAEVE